MSPRARDAGEEAAAGGASTAADRAPSGSQDAQPGAHCSAQRPSPFLAVPWVCSPVHHGTVQFITGRCAAVPVRHSSSG
eukprot:scaffold6494_cov129-Isochrysis_galbana.AAC.1